MGAQAFAFVTLQDCPQHPFSANTHPHNFLLLYHPWPAPSLPTASSFSVWPGTQ